MDPSVQEFVDSKLEELQVAIGFSIEVVSLGLCLGMVLRGAVHGEAGSNKKEIRYIAAFHHADPKASKSLK